MPSCRKGMVLPLLLVVLFFGSLLAGLALKEVESAAELSRIHLGQLGGDNEGLSALARGINWLRQRMFSGGTLPRWLDDKPFEDGLLCADEWAASGKANLLVHEEDTGSPDHCRLEVYDLDYRFSEEMEQDGSLPPSFFDLFSVSGGTEMAKPEVLNHLYALNDVSLSGDVAARMENGEDRYSGEGEACLVFEEDESGNSLSNPNGEIVIRFRLTGSLGTYPDGFDLGFRLAPVKDFPEKAFNTGYSASFSVDGENRPENRDRFLIKQHANSEEGKSEVVLATIPFPYCRSSNLIDQDRYQAYLSQPHEIRLRFVPGRVTAVLDPGEGILEKTISAPIDPVAANLSSPMVCGLRVRGRSGGTLSIASLRIHPADAQGYFPECRKTGFYMVRATVRGPRQARVFETIVSADLATKKITTLAWEERPFF